MAKSRTQFAAVGLPPLPTPRLALSIPEFCKAHGISEGFFYKLKKQGEGPREMKVGARTLISFEAAAEWRGAQHLEARHPGRKLTIKRVAPEKLVAHRPAASSPCGACGGTEMKYADNSVPAGMIFICRAFDTLYQTITPDWRNLEADERLKTSSPYLDDPRDKANREAWRSYDQARRRASQRMREALSQGALIALFWDSEKKRDQEVIPEKWASMGDFEALTVFESGTVIVGGPLLYFDSQSFNNYVKGIAPPDGDRTAHPGGNAPAASKTKTGLQDQIREINNQLLAEGFKGRKKERNRAIRGKFQNPPGERTIRRALKPD
jgi:predicted DNA-binding transcriptional regulator AlpA